MKIGLIGDIHGRVFHALAIVSMLQKLTQPLDLIIQVGDLGAYPNPSEEVRNDKFNVQDSTQLDFSRLFTAEGKLADDLQQVRKLLHGPIHFIRGNHEDFDWLNGLSARHQISRTDPFGLFSYVADGTVLEINDFKIGFLGGIETRGEEPRSIYKSMYRKLYAFNPRKIDLLVTHDAPYGIGTNYHGQTQGSQKITKLIERIQPRYLVAGHYHHMIGLRYYGNTLYLGLNVIVDLRKDPERRRVQPGSFAVLDTDNGSLNFVVDEWLERIDCHFDFSTYVEN